MHHSRQLAAIMFIDIAGYTSLMETDEILALRFREKLKIKLETEVGIYGGKIIKWMGDGALCSFDSANACVRTALALQLNMQQQPKVPVRIGIHQADIIFEDSDVHGDGVNIASRLESLAIPGSIFISAKVYDDIKNQKDIQTVSLGKYLLKNVKEPVEIFAISNAGLQVPHNKKLEGKGIKYVSNKISIAKKTLLIRLGAIIMALAVAGFVFIPPIVNKQNARNKLLPAIQKLVNENFRPPTEAFDLAVNAEKYIATDSALIKLWPTIATAISIETEPAGAEVFWKDYHTPDAEWRLAGITPLKDVRFPRGYIRMEIRKNGFQIIEYAGPMAFERLGSDIDTLKLDASGSLPENMVRIPKKETPMFIIGLEEHGGKEVGEFLMDKFEVTNSQYKIFMNAGGYANKSFWKYPVYSNGKEILLEAALKLFTDKTGRPGPANWEAETYPDGQGNHPVTGISWYEAAAYVAYVNKQLPTVYHWGRIAETSRTEFIVPLSNYNGKSTTAVGSMAGYNSFGIYDLAGNAREWCLNESSLPGQRFILGGGWNDPTYFFNNSYTQSAMDRSLTNGFRCIKKLPGDTVMVQLTKTISSVALRDYNKEKPVDDKTFSIYLNQYVYDIKPLDIKVETKIDGESWTAEKMSFDAGYNNERMMAFLFLPKNFQPPYQTVLYVLCPAWSPWFPRFFCEKLRRENRSPRPSPPRRPRPPLPPAPHQKRSRQRPSPPHRGGNHLRNGRHSGQPLSSRTEARPRHVIESQYLLRS